VGWYDAVQWVKLKQVAQDAASLDDSYEAWLRNAQNLERELQRKGIEIQRVNVNVESLVAWCQARNKPINGAVRSEYAAYLAASKEPT
jgi:hypothetical protein